MLAKIFYDVPPSSHHLAGREGGVQGDAGGDLWAGVAHHHRERRG